LAGLLLRAEETSRLFRFADQPQWTDPKTGYVRRQIFCNPSHPMEVVEVEMPPGKKASFPASSYVNLKHVVWVEEGELVLSEGGERHVLKTGDSLGFGPPSEVTYANESKKPCRYIVALTRS
jgi:quercetin dioxygenase-like cupin family protein